MFKNFTRAVLLLALTAPLAFAANSPVIWGPGNAATVIPPVLNVRTISMSGSTPLTGTGTISVTASGTTVTGTGTDFITRFRTGFAIIANGETHYVTAIASDTSMTTDAWTSTATAVAYASNSPTAFTVYPSGTVQVGGTRTTPATYGSNIVGARYIGVSTPKDASSAANNSNLYLIAFGGNGTSSGSIVGHSVSGTEASPTAIGTNRTLLNILGRGYDGSSWTGTSAQIAMTSTEAFSSTAHGTKLAFATTPNGSTSLSTALVLDQDQTATFTKTVLKNISTITGSTSAASTTEVYLCNANSGAVTVTLPAASSNIGVSFSIKKIDSSANACTIGITGGDTIDGLSTWPISVQYVSINVVSNGSGWWVL